MTQFRVISSNDLSIPSYSCRFCADRSIVGHLYVSNAAMTLAIVSATIPVLFSDGTRRYGVPAPFYVAGTDVEMCKSFNLKKTLYDSSTVVQIAERFEPNTVLWAFHTIQPSSKFCARASSD